MTKNDYHRIALEFQQGRISYEELAKAHKELQRDEAKRKVIK